MNAISAAAVGGLGPLALVAAFVLLRDGTPLTIRGAARAQLAFGLLVALARAGASTPGAPRAALLATVPLLGLAVAAIGRCAVAVPSDTPRPRRRATRGVELAVLVAGLLATLLAFDAVRDAMSGAAARGPAATALATVVVDALALARRAPPAARLFRAVAFGGALPPLLAALGGSAGGATALVTASLLAPAALAAAPLLPRLAVTGDIGSDAPSERPTS